MWLFWDPALVSRIHRGHAAEWLWGLQGEPQIDHWRSRLVQLPIRIAKTEWYKEISVRQEIRNLLKQNRTSGIVGNSHEP